MKTALIILLVVVVVAAAAYFVLRGRSGGGHGLRRRFGPEYDRVVARHDGDTKAAELELSERVKRHGSLTRPPLTAGAREQYTARWTHVQERFVDSPQEAVAEADALLTELSRDRGFPADARFEERADALSVHHPHHVHGFRRVHAALNGGGGTEEMRESLVEARGLFDALLGGDKSAPATDDQHRHPTKGSVTS
ncbi:hypothetical protein [uncultured Streptomyces sp.]|uniref:hypothetical protein n=1 Tax=uncultured Streptomyces sp. TaxID=174707 RepID=UPI00260DE2E9|nr:hypothetical protein [uncultured Streptomyces sp.]